MHIVPQEAPEEDLRIFRLSADFRGTPPLADYVDESVTEPCPDSDNEASQAQSEEGAVMDEASLKEEAEAEFVSMAAAETPVDSSDEECGVSGLQGLRQTDKEAFMTEQTNDDADDFMDDQIEVPTERSRCSPEAGRAQQSMLGSPEPTDELSERDG